MAANSQPAIKEEEEKKLSEAMSPAEQNMDSSVKQEDAAAACPRSKGNSPVPPRASSPSNSARSHPVPIMTNSTPINRPPSSASVHSTGSAGPRTTTTSRRGGRTRARSPPTMIQRPSSTGPPPEPFIPVEDRRSEPPSPANPSAAAAAAAAAAKSITRNPPPPSSWYESPEARDREARDREARDRDYRRSRPEGGPPPARYHGGSSRYGYEDSHRNNWPEEEAARAPSRGRSYSRREEQHYGYREGYYRGGRGARGEQQYPPSYEQDNMEYEGRGGPRYPDSRYDERGPRTTSPRPPGYDYRGRERDHRAPPRDDPYFKNKESEGARAEAGAPHSVKRTTRVIGTATPIHVPRATDPSRNARGAASVFRGRPGSDLRGSSVSGQEDDSPQSILMALRTPSTSFEEKPTKHTSRGHEHPLSPEAPPQIHHSHHQSATDSSLFFEPQRSPKSQSGPPQPTSSIDMAPSFSLFTQSFDSIGGMGDTAGFFDTALQSTSFGVAPSASDDKGNELQLSGSAGNYSTQLLGGSGSGALTFGMSPNNSFGGGPPTLRTGNMMVLGGQDHRSASPSQVLDMYRSYSGGGGPSPRSKGGPLEDNHVRMSGATLGSPSIGNFSRSFGEAPPPPPPSHYRSNSMRDGPDGTPHFYLFLKKHHSAFLECTFLLPGLKAAMDAANINREIDADETPKRHTRAAYGEPPPQEIAIATRRVASAVCAFGGTFMGDRTVHQKKTNSQSIFRNKSSDAVTVTPSSSTSTSPGNSNKSHSKSKYDEKLPGRYYENDNRLSWEFEENPPIYDFGKKDGDGHDDTSDGKDGDRSKNSSGDGSDKKDNSDEGDSKGGEGGKKSPNGDQPKMRYRCKLCGQPKQNHTCPYQQSLARSIGAMVYPSVNAFTSAEPGMLAPALTEMNNFILSGSDSVSSAETSPSRPTPDRIRRMNQGMPSSSAQVTPESLRGTPRGANSPVSTPVRSCTPGSARRTRGNGNRFTPGGSPPRKKRSHLQMGGGSEDQGDLLFVDAVDLKPEQFRIVTQSKAMTVHDAFTYPSLPLPYAQRKRLSDNLFSLSKEIPQLTDECAAVLREAREKDLWDLAVAELMTQVVVVVHCLEGDSRFEGLRRYLLTLGISC